MKHQALSIEIIDRRKNPPEKRQKHFTRHQDYLNAMGHLMNMPDVHLSEDTRTTVTVYPIDEGSLFEQEHTC